MERTDEGLAQYIFDFMFKEASSISELTDVEFLSGLVGPIHTLERSPLKTVGFSGTTHERFRMKLTNDESRSFILKNIRAEQDMSVWRTGDVAGREALLLRDRQLDHIWNIFDSPYLAYSIEDQNYGLLMYDLTEFLFPDIREPLERSKEESLLKVFAKLHADFWEHPMLSNIAWLTQESMFFGFLSPNAVQEERLRGRTNPLFEHVEAGWMQVRGLISDNLWEFLNKPAVELQLITSGLPKTLLHGDSKVANFAIGHNRCVKAFDWAMIANGSSSCEIGWYIAVNATRLTRSKEEILLFYRNELEKNLGSQFSDYKWNRMDDAAILTGAMTLLWSKAINLQKGLSGSQEEWSWWTNRIERIRSEYFS